MSKATVAEQQKLHDRWTERERERERETKWIRNVECGKTYSAAARPAGRRSVMWQLANDRDRTISRIIRRALSLVHAFCGSCATNGRGAERKSSILRSQSRPTCTR